MGLRPRDPQGLGSDTPNTSRKYFKLSRFYWLGFLITFIKECARRFPVALYGHDNSNKQDKFVLQVSPDMLKCVLTLTGDSITNAVSLFLS